MTHTHPSWLRWLTLLLVMVLVGGIAPSPKVSAQSTPQQDPIDMERDDDGDGVPDELAEEVHRLAAMIAADRYNEEIPEVAREIMHRLPYAAETRERQQQMATLTEQLYETDDDTAAQTIVEQMRALEADMLTDPGYAETSAALERMLFQTPAQTWRNRVYLPMIGFRGQLTGQQHDPTVQEHVAADLELQRGDVLLRDGHGSSSGSSVTDFFYKVVWGHAGIVESNESVYSSNVEGVRFEDYEAQWVARVDRIWQGRAWDVEAQAAVVASLEAAQERYGTDGRTPYNYNLADKQTDERLYCSQLVWKIYDGAGIDLDSNHPIYVSMMFLKGHVVSPLPLPDTGSGVNWAVIALLAVALDEIALDDDLRFINMFVPPRD